jgi:hypothetical protein
MSKALDLANGDLYLSLFVGTASPTFTGTVTVADGSNDINIASHDGTNGLKLGGTLVTADANEINIIDGVTATTAELNIMDGITATTSELNSAGTHINLATAQAEANSSATAMAIALG